MLRNSLSDCRPAVPRPQASRQRRVTIIDRSIVQTERLDSLAWSREGTNENEPQGVSLNHLANFLRKLEALRSVLVSSGSGVDTGFRTRFSWMRQPAPARGGGQIAESPTEQARERTLPF